MSLPYEAAPRLRFCRRATVNALLAEGLMDGLPVGEGERIFALGFALQQLQQSFSELAACLQEWARHPDGASPSRWQSGLKHVALPLASITGS